MLLAFVAPALAVQPEVTPIKAIQVGAPTSWEKEWFSGDILHRTGVVAQGTIRLFIPAQQAPQRTPLDFYNIYHVAADTVDTNGPYVVIVYAKWIYEDSVTKEVYGTFEGQINWNINSPSDAHGLLKGTGQFEGQTLKFWEDPTTHWNTMVWNIEGQINNPIFLFL